MAQSADVDHLRNATGTRSEARQIGRLGRDDKLHAQFLRLAFKPTRKVYRLAQCSQRRRIAARLPHRSDPAQNGRTAVHADAHGKGGRQGFPQALIQTVKDAVHRPRRRHRLQCGNSW